MTPEQVKEVMQSMTEEDFQDLARKETRWRIRFIALLLATFAAGVYVGIAIGLLL